VTPFRRDPLADPEQLIRRVYSYVAYMVGDGADAEDIASATIERALRYRGSYDPRRGSPIAWLLGIARNCIADRHREPLAAPDEELDELVAPEGSLDHVDRLAVQTAVARLGPRDRELIALRYGADLSARQIGTELGLRANAVEVALHRAHARLRVLLAEDFARNTPVDAA
jgi:RNA polymerase sigma-70 factor (ECF subfamily)